MSTWRNIPNQDVELDGEDINVLLDSDNQGNNYVTISKAHVQKLLSETLSRDNLTEQEVKTKKEWVCLDCGKAFRDEYLFSRHEHKNSNDKKGK